MQIFSLKEEYLNILYELAGSHPLIKKIKATQNGENFSMSKEEMERLIVFLDDLILDKGMLEQDCFNWYGYRLQKAYDSLCNQADEA
ncbi:MAG: hypothetical protein RR396_01065 [Clostridiales bacterium]